MCSHNTSMINEQIITYVAVERARGVSNDAIRGALLTQGWKGEDVDSAMGDGVSISAGTSRDFSLQNLFEGRLMRWQYFITGLQFGLVFLAIVVGVGLSSGFTVSMEVIDRVGWVFYLLCLPFYLSLQIRRLHDLNWSAWYVLLAIVPVANIVLGILMLFKKGTEGVNLYGPPQANRSFLRTLLNT